MGKKKSKPEKEKDYGPKPCNCIYLYEEKRCSNEKRIDDVSPVFRHNICTGRYSSCSFRVPYKEVTREDDIPCN